MAGGVASAGARVAERHAAALQVEGAQQRARQLVVQAGAGLGAGRASGPRAPHAPRRPDGERGRAQRALHQPIAPLPQPRQPHHLDPFAGARILARRRGLPRRHGLVHRLVDHAHRLAAELGAGIRRGDDQRLRLPAAGVPELIHHQPGLGEGAMQRERRAGVGEGGGRDPGSKAHPGGIGHRGAARSG
jgi:hypothetical protein